MASVIVRSQVDIPVGERDLVAYLRSRDFEIRPPSRPFRDIEDGCALALVDMRKAILTLPPNLLMETGYDVGCADVAGIPLILLVDDKTLVPKEWLMCSNVFHSTADKVKETVDIFIAGIQAYQQRFLRSDKADISSRRILRALLINNINKIIDNKAARFIKEKKKEL